MPVPRKAAASGVEAEVFLTACEAHLRKTARTRS